MAEAIITDRAKVMGAIHREAGVVFVADRGLQRMNVRRVRMHREDRLSQSVTTRMAFFPYRSVDYLHSRRSRTFTFICAWKSMYIHDNMIAGAHKTLHCPRKTGRRAGWTTTAMVFSSISEFLV